MSDVHERLRALGLTLPTPTATTFAYTPALRYRDTVYLAGQIPKTGTDRLLVTGVIGDSVSLDMGRDAVKLSMLHALAWIAQVGGGIDQVARILRVRYFFQANAHASRTLSILADVGSNLLMALFGEQGRHVRSVMGVSSLPRNAPVLVEVDAALQTAEPQHGSQTTAREGWQHDVTTLPCAIHTVIQHADAAGP